MAPRRPGLLVLLSLVASVFAGCDTRETNGADSPDAAGKADEVDTASEAEEETDGADRAQDPIVVEVELHYDCGEMGSDGEPFDHPGFSGDEFDLRLVVEAEFPASCQSEFSAQCRVRLPSQCWSTQVSLNEDRLSVSGQAGDADSSLFGSVPLLAISAGEVEIGSSPDSASNGFGSLAFTLRAL
jgi:hypothetical protein